MPALGDPTATPARVSILGPFTRRADELRTFDDSAVGHGYAAFCSFRQAAHRAFCAAAILLRAAGDSDRVVRLAVETVAPFTLAQRAR